MSARTSILRPYNSVLQGDCLDVLPTLDAESVQCVVTSPPYWGLRDYGVVGQLGLEPTPEAYVERMVAVFREVRRALRKDGTLWLVLGDGYAANRTYQVTDSKHVDVGNTKGSSVPLGCKPKDLLGIPWLVAFALRADGWWLRAENIWSKPNPMPESVRDRTTRAHETLFLLTRSERYYYDADAIAEPAQHSGPNGPQHSPYGQGFTRRSDKQAAAAAAGNGATQRRQTGFNDRWVRCLRLRSHPLTRNKRSVWTISTQAYPEAHFATFPEDLVEPCILAGSRPCDVVMDPFAGSGTTLAVAKRLDREYLGIELNPEYIALAERRLAREGRQIVAAL